MICVTRLNGKEFWINPHMIETVEESPDTVIRLLNDRKYIVLEKAEDLNRAIINYRKKIGWMGNEYESAEE